MDYQVRIAEAALADFEEILAYSWAHFPGGAERFGNAILNHAELLKSFPYIGAPVAGRSGIRQWIHTPKVIYYRVHEEANFVEIVQFWHAKRASGTLADG